MKAQKILWIIVIIGIVAGIIVYSNSLSLVNEPAYTPVFTNIQCTDTMQNANLAELQVPFSGGSYFCPKSMGNVYIGNSKCKFTVRTSIGFLASNVIVKDCEIGSDNCKTLTFKPLDSAQTVQYEVENNRRLYVNPSSLIGGKTYLKGEVDVWGLRLEKDDNLLSFTSDCSIESLGYSYNALSSTSGVITEINKNNLPVVDGKHWLMPSQYINMVTGQRLGRSSSLITRSDINNGQPIYVVDKGYYQKTQRTTDGVLFVVGEIIPDNRIECIPQVFCDYEAKSITVPSQTSCTETFGNTVGYIPFDNSGKLCKSKCDVASGKLVATTDCIDYTACPQDKPFRDYLTGECKAGDSKQETCPAGSVLVQKQSSQCNFLCKIGITQPTITQVSYCKEQSDLTGVWIIVGALILAGGLILMGGKKK